MIIKEEFIWMILMIILSLLLAFLKITLLIHFGKKEFSIQVDVLYLDLINGVQFLKVIVVK